MSNVNDHTECSYDCCGHDSRDHDCRGYIHCTTVAAATVAGTPAAATSDAGSTAAATTAPGTTAAATTYVEGWCRTTYVERDAERNVTLSNVNYVERDVERDVTVMLNVMYDLYDRLRLLWNHECDGCGGPRRLVRFLEGVPTMSRLSGELLRNAGELSCPPTPPPPRAPCRHFTNPLPRPPDHRSSTASMHHNPRHVIIALAARPPLDHRPPHTNETLRIRTKHIPPSAYERNTIGIRTKHEWHTNETLQYGHHSHYAFVLE